MKKYSKKVFIALMFVLVGFTLVACKPKLFKVEFDSNGGSDVKTQEVAKGKTATLPDTPQRDGYIFEGWFANEALEGDAYKFATPVNANLKLYAKWAEKGEDQFVRFTDHNQGTTNLIKATDGVVGKPTDPTRENFKFAGWFTTKRGLTWLEESAKTFPLNLGAGVDTLELFAYWEPVRSDKADWTANETYRSTITKQSRMIFSPFNWDNNLESDMMANMATSLYSTEVDWDKAIRQGVAAFPGDFSKFESGEFSIEALDYHNILVGAAKYPMNNEGDELLDEDGNYDRTAATTRTSREWTYTLREDLVFQDGTPITAYTYQYTLQQMLDNLQNNSRANSYYRTEENKNGVPIANAFEYFSQSVMKLDGEGKPVRDEDDKIVYEAKEVTWDQVGFEVINDHQFKLTFHEAYTQAGAVGFGSFRLVHPGEYAKSLDSKGNSTYGTSTSPFISYGPYVMKSWDQNQKIVMNKNYDYVLKGTINYKSMVYELVDNPEQTLNLFRGDEIDVIGINATNFEEFAERTNIYRSFAGFPSFLTINTAPSTAPEATRHKPDTILFDKEFRQALLYGFDRIDFNENYDVPNLPSFVPVPGDIKNYVQDTQFFVESPQYLKVLQDIGVDPNNYGYMTVRSLELFDQAYERWLGQGNTGPAKLKMITADTEVDILLGNRVKAVYEDLFTKNGVKRLIIEVANLNSAQKGQASREWNFDLTLGGLGFGGSLGTYWQMGAIAFAGASLGGAHLGLSQPYSTNAAGERVLAEYTSEIIEVDLTTTYEYIVARGGFDYLEEEELTNTAKMFTWLQEEKDADGVVTKPAGLLREELLDLVLWTLSGDEPWDATAEEPFPGAGADANEFAAAMLAVFYDHVTHIPTGTSASAALYADKVVVTWPAYSTAFGWGANRYRHLNTDKDFQ